MISDSILQRIYRASLKFYNTLSLAQTYKVIAHEAMDLVDAEGAIIVTRQKNKFVRLYASSKRAASVNIRNKGFTYECFTKKKSFVITPKDFDHSHPEAIKVGIKSGIFIPLTYEKKVKGVLIVQSFTKKNFNTKEIDTHVRSL